MMGAHHPLQRQLERTGEHRAEMRIRHQLQTQARTLLRDVLCPAHTGDALALATLRGRVVEYLAIRNLLTPGVAADGYMRELQGALHRLDAQLRNIKPD